MPLPRLLKIWAEVWRPAEQRLADMESRLRARGAIVAPGGPYDRWDLEARHGWSGAIRISTAVEEHGGGRQLVRVRLRPRFAAAVVTVIPVLVTLALLAWADSAGTAAVALAGAAAFLGALAVRSAGEAMSSVLQHARAPERDSIRQRREAPKMKLEGT